VTPSTCQTAVSYHHVEHARTYRRWLASTNNSVEGWRHAFQSSVACHHPTIYTLIDLFRREQDSTEQTTIRIHSGICSQPASKFKYVQLSRRLAATVATYEGRDIMDYLRAVSHKTEIQNVVNMMILTLYDILAVT
jgi:hypothetical protein